MVQENEDFVNNIVWSNEAQFKLISTVERHDCVYETPENPHLHVEIAKFIGIERVV